MANEVMTGSPTTSNANPRRDEELSALTYHSGFGNDLATEAVPGALPVGQNAPQRVPFGLYAEQISGTAFTAPRALNRRSWCYRIRPGAMHGAFREIDGALWKSGPFTEVAAPPDQMRWSPFSIDGAADFISSMATIA